MLMIKGGTINKVPVLYVNVTHANIKQLQRIQYAALYPKSGKCYFPAYSPILTFCMKDIDKVFSSYQIDDRGKEIIKGYKAFMELYKKQHLRADFDFVMKPHHHQAVSLLDLIYNFRWNLNIDPGLGKTKIIIDYLRYLMKSTLIIAPSSLLPNWVDEFDKHSNGELKVTIFSDDVKAKRIQVYDEKGVAVRDSKGKLKKKNISAKKLKTEWLKNLKTDVLLVGYASAAIYREELFEYYDYDIMVLDESHRIKSFDGRNSVGVVKLSQKAYRRVTMSGTYILNSPVDAWSQLQFLSPQITNKSFYNFRTEYCVFDKRYRHQVVGFKNMDKANRLINRFSTIFTKDDITDMAERTVIKQHYELSPEQIKWTEDVLSGEDLIFPDGNITKEHKVTLLGKLGQIAKGYVNLSNKDPNICDGCNWVADCVENKIKPYSKLCNVVKKAPKPTVKRLKSNPCLALLKDLLTDLLETKSNKAIVWCKGVEDLEIISEYLEEAKIGYVRITDSNSTIPKVRQFNENGTTRILLSSVATGIGYTANAARYSIYYSMNFSLEHYLQSRDRNHRLNTMHSVFEYHLVGRNTIDEPTFVALEFKQDIKETLLKNINCNLCPHKKRCAAEGIIIFGNGCKFKTKATKTRIKV